MALQVKEKLILPIYSIKPVFCEKSKRLGEETRQTVDREFYSTIYTHIFYRTLCVDHAVFVEIH